MYHNILLVFGLIILWHHDVCHWSVLTWLWCIEQSYILFWILFGSGTAYCLNWRYLHWLYIEIVYCVFDAEKLILSKWGEHTAETLGGEFKLAENIWWREPTILWVLDYEIHWHCEDNGYIGSFLSVWELCDEMFRYFEDNTYIIVIVTYGSYTWSYGMHFIVPEKTLVISMRTTLFWEDFGLHCGLAITVVERLQRYNCIWLTYIDNVEQNILFYIEVWSCEMLSLCGKLIWRRNVVFWLCFAYRSRLYRYLVWITSFLRS